MKLHIHQPAALHENGSQSLNEDFIFPLLDQASSEERLFIVCDGEGGPQAGEVAAKMVALGFAKFFASTPPAERIDQEYLDRALYKIEESLSAYKEAHPEAADMATTLALLHLGEEQVTMAWVGDSQVFYYDRKNSQLTSTAEHQEGSGSGARIRGKEQPARIRMKFLPIGEVHPRDYFLLATRPLVDQVDPNTLHTIFSTEDSPEKMTPDSLIKEIQNLTLGMVDANHACYLVQLKADPAAAAAPGAEPAKGQPATDSSPMTGAALPSWVRQTGFGLLGLLFIFLVVLAWWATRKTPYQESMAEASALLHREAYEQAMSQYDAAKAKTSKPEEIQAAEAGYAQARSMLLQANGGELPIHMLTEPSEVYLNRGNEFFRLGNYEHALKAYQNAQRKAGDDSALVAALPLDRMAEAHLKVADAAFEQPGASDKAAEHYAAALELYQQPAVTAPDRSILDQANARLAESEKILAAAQPEPKSGSASPLAAAKEDTENAPAPSSSNTRSLGPREKNKEPPASSGATEGTNSDRSVPAPNLARRTSNNPPSGLSRGLEVEERAELEKMLSAGKRQFIEAREKESGYLYQLSASNLESAMPVLDGPAAYMLAYIHHAGLGGEQDKAKALKYAQQSALKGWAAGQYLYAHLLLTRRNPRDTITAKQSLRLASNQNYLEAQQRLRELGD